MTATGFRLWCEKIGACRSAGAVVLLALARAVLGPVFAVAGFQAYNPRHARASTKHGVNRDRGDSL